MPEEDRSTRVRRLAFTDDLAWLVAQLRAEWPQDSLQLIGDALIRAVAAQVDGAVLLAERCASGLRERRWEGDEELADALEARMGTGPTPALRAVPVDLEELAMQLEGDPYQESGRLELTTGEVWSASSIEYGVEEGEIEADDDDPDRWLSIPRQGSRDGYRDMGMFISGVQDERLAIRLERAINGRGAFRRFKVALADAPDLLAEWYSFSNERQRGRARSWLADEGYQSYRRGGGPAR